MQVIKGFRYAVGGIKGTEFKAGTEASALPPDARAYAQRKNLLGEAKGKKSVDEAENKAVEGAPEDKGSKSKGGVFARRGG